jgi:hypothetical protein
MKFLRTTGFDGLPVSINAERIILVTPYSDDKYLDQTRIIVEYPDAEGTLVVKESYSSIVKKLEAL